MRRVAVTGVGLLTALGVNRTENWKQLLHGHSAVRRIRSYDPTSLRTRLGAEIDDFVPERYASRRALRMTTRNDQLAVAGAVLAVADSGVDLESHPAERLGLFLGGNKEICDPQHLLDGTIGCRREDGSADIRRLGERAMGAYYPLYYVQGLQSAALFYISSRLGLRGPNAYFHGTADAGAVAIGRAFRSIRRGESDVAIAGGYDDATSWWSMSKTDALGVLTNREDLAERAVRPYDLARSGTVLGEGSAFLVLEDQAAARRRGAHIYAEITGFGSTFDGDRVLTPDPTGAPLAAAIGRALAESHVDPGTVGYVATHGSATRLGDVSEARALRTALSGGHGSSRIHASSVKPATGHLVAGAGALNVAVCALAIDEGAAPATLNLEDPDPRCADPNGRIDWVTGAARELQVGRAVALARGLHGQQVALALGGSP